MPLDRIIADENLLVLAANPGDETLYCGGLIARCCTRGRPPFVMVLTDGSGVARRMTGVTGGRAAAVRERETRAAAERLGVARDRLLMVGLFDGAVPAEGPVFDAVVRAVTLVMWARDCTVICAPAGPPGGPGDAHHAEAAAVAAAVAARSGVGWLGYGSGALRLAPGAFAAARREAAALHRVPAGEGDEMFSLMAGLAD